MSLTEATHDSATAVQHDKIKPFTLRLYVPRDVDSGLLTVIKRLLARNHGGFTCFETSGGWVSDDGELIEETTDVIETSVSTLESRFDSPAEYAHHWCAWIESHTDETEAMAELRSVDVVTVR